MVTITTLKEPGNLYLTGVHHNDLIKGENGWISAQEASLQHGATVQELKKQAGIFGDKYTVGDTLQVNNINGEAVQTLTITRIEAIDPAQFDDFPALGYVDYADFVTREPAYSNGMAWLIRGEDHAK